MTDRGNLQTARKGRIARRSAGGSGVRGIATSPKPKSLPLRSARYSPRLATPSSTSWKPSPSSNAMTSNAQPSSTTPARSTNPAPTSPKTPSSPSTTKCNTRSPRAPLPDPAQSTTRSTDRFGRQRHRDVSMGSQQSAQPHSSAAGCACTFDGEGRELTGPTWRKESP
jgi:hypothetical protein